MAPGVSQLDGGGVHAHRVRPRFGRDGRALLAGSCRSDAGYHSADFLYFTPPGKVHFATDFALKREFEPQQGSIDAEFEVGRFCGAEQMILVSRCAEPPVLPTQRELQVLGDSPGGPHFEAA
jgi:hypothetical protein